MAIQPCVPSHALKDLKLILRTLLAKEVARQLGVTSAAVSSWKLAKSSPKPWARQRLFEVFNIAPELWDAPLSKPLPPSPKASAKVAAPKEREVSYRGSRYRTTWPALPCTCLHLRWAA